jgi:WD40 repeat protein
MHPHKPSKTPLTACLLLLSLPSLLIAQGRTHVDRFADPLPPGAVMRLGSGRFLHGHMCQGGSGLAFLPGDKQIIAGSLVSYCHVWDRTTGREVRRFLGEGAWWCAAASPDGKFLATSEMSGQLTVWNVKTGKPIWCDRAKSKVQTIAWSPDGRTLAYQFGEGFKLTDASTGKVRNQIADPGHRGSRSFIFHPGGKELLARCDDGVFRIWDVATTKELRRLKDTPIGHCTHLTLSPDGRTVVACFGWDRTGADFLPTRLWDFATGELIRSLPSNKECSAAFSPDGRLLATGRNGAHITLWDVSTGKQVRQWQVSDPEVNALAFSSDGKILASAGYDRRVRLWDPITGKETFPVHGHSGAVQAVAFGSLERTVVSGGQDQTIRLWDWVTGEEKQTFSGAGKKEYRVCGLAYSPDGKTIASVDKDGFLDRVRLWDVQTGKLRARFGPQNWYQTNVAFFPDGKSLASTHCDDMVRICDSATGKLLRRIETEWLAYTLAMSSDGKTIACFTAREGVVVWDVQTGKRRYRLDKGTEDELPRILNKRRSDLLAISADGSVLVSLPEHRYPRFWNALTGEFLRDGDDCGFVRAIALSSDGTVLAGAVGNYVFLWDVLTGKQIRSFAGHLLIVNALAFDPTGKVLVSAGDEGVLLVWDLTGLLAKGRLSSVKMTPKELAEKWKVLVGDDPAKAHQAAWSLAACPQTVPFIQKRLRPIKPAGPSVRQWIADLDDDSFIVREKASAGLEALGEPAVPALQKVLATEPTQEVQARIKMVLKRIKQLSAAERFRVRRALTVLERSPSPEARRLLESLAAGAAGTNQTEEAKAALWRLDFRR